MRKSGSEDDVFSAVGGMELGRHEPGMYADPAAGGYGGAGGGGQMPSSQAGGLPQSGEEGSQFARGSSGGVRYGLGPMIGDLPFSDTPSRTLIVRNVTAACSDQELQQLFEVRWRPPSSSLPPWICMPRSSRGKWGSQPEFKKCVSSPRVRQAQGACAKTCNRPYMTSPSRMAERRMCIA
jgi:hypothetical protein